MVPLQEMRAYEGRTVYLGLESLPDGDEGFAGDVFDLGSDEVIMIGKVVQDRKHECGEATPIKTPRTLRTFRWKSLFGPEFAITFDPNGFVSLPSIHQTRR